MVAMAQFSAAHAAEKALGVVRARLRAGIFHRVVDAPHFEAGMKGVPGRGFIGVDGCCTRVEAAFDEALRRVFALERRRQGPAKGTVPAHAFPDDRNTLTLAAAMLRQAAVFTVRLAVFRPDMPAKNSPIDLALPAPPICTPFICEAIASRSLWARTKAVLY